MTDKDGSNRQGDLPTEQAAPPGLAFYDTKPSDSTVSLEFIAKIIRRAMQDHAAPATVRSERAAREIADRLGVHLLTAAETDPMERICGQALRAAGVAFITDHEAASPARLDFYLPESDLHIEVKRFHSERVAEQLRRAENVILLQGAGAVQFFASMALDMVHDRRACPLCKTGSVVSSGHGVDECRKRAAQDELQRMGVP